MRGYYRKEQFKANGTKAQNERAEYVCSSYARKMPDCDCNRHTIHQDEIVAKLKQWLAECGIELRTMIQTVETGNLDLLKPYKDRHVRSAIKAAMHIGRMMHYVTSFEGWEELAKEMERRPVTEDDFFFYFADQISELYRTVFAVEELELHEEIHNLEKQREQLTRRVLRLPENAKRAIADANDQILTLEEKLDELEKRLTNWADEFEGQREEMLERLTAYEDAEHSLFDDKDAANRRKAEVVKRVVSRIDCQFRPTGRKYPKSELESITIIPLMEEEGPNSGLL